MNFEDFKNIYQKKEPTLHNLSTINEPLLTVAIQTYNHENCIRDCIEGICNQECTFPFDILIMEDSSSDRTQEICIELADKYKERITLFLNHRVNNISINSNPTGRFSFLYNIYFAKGKYIAICDGDDYWVDSHKLQNQINFLEDNPEYSGCFTDFMTVSSEGIIISESTFNELESEIDHLSILKRQTPKTLTTVYRAKHVQGNLPDLFTKCLNADLVLSAYVSKHGPYKYMNRVTGAYRVHDGGIWSLISQKKRYQSQIDTSLRMMDYFTNRDEIDALRHRLKMANQALEKLYRKEKQYSKILWCKWIKYYSMLKYRPSDIFKKLIT